MEPGLKQEERLTADVGGMGTAFGCPALSKHMCFVLIRLARSELRSRVCLLRRGLIKAVQAQGMKPTETDQQQQQRCRAPKTASLATC